MNLPSLRRIGLVTNLLLASIMGARSLAGATPATTTLTPQQLQRYVANASQRDKDPQAWYDLAIAAKKAGQTDVEETALQHVTEIKVTSFKAWNNLGLLYFKKQDYQKAIDCFRRAVTVNDNYAGAWSNLGNTCRAINRLAEAEQCYLKAVAINPRFAGAWYNLGNYYASQNKLPDARECYLTALKIEPSYSRAWLSLAHARKTLGEDIEATEAMERATELEPALATHAPKK